MSELNISLISSRNNNKGEYISIDQVVKYEGEACIKDQALHDKINQVGRDFIGIQENKNIFYLNRKVLPIILNRG